jgi:hypothetical protein
MKYEVTEGFLLGQTKTFKRDQIVTPEELTEAGFDVEFLKKNNSIEVLRGTEGPAVVTTVRAPVPAVEGGTIHMDARRAQAKK